MTRRCAVLGRPIAHSLSPVLHRAAYATLGIDWTYDALEVDEATLAGFVAGLGSEWRGLSLTMPLKRAVLSMLDSVDAQAERSGVANTVILEEGARRGANTDIPGAVAALRERGVDSPRSAIVLGGGATAASTLLALADLGCTEVQVAVRSAARAEESLGVLQRHPRPPAAEVVELEGPFREADVVVSTIPARAQTPALVAQLRAALGGGGAIFDVVYDPWPTPLVSAAPPECAVVSGLDLLVHQAVLQVELMTGAVEPTGSLAERLVSAMRAAGEEALAARARAPR